MNKKYTESLTLEKELYEKLKDRKTKLKEIGGRVKAINTLYDETETEKEKEKEKFNGTPTEVLFLKHV